jgi:D-amino peptidase
LETVVVKQAVGRTAAKNLHPERVREMIRAAAARALKRKREPFVLRPPITLRLALGRTSQAERCALMPSVKRIAPRVIEYSHDDSAALFDAFYVLLSLAEIQA